MLFSNPARAVIERFRKLRAVAAGKGVSGLCAVCSAWWRRSSAGSFRPEVGAAGENRARTSDFHHSSFSCARAAAASGSVDVIVVVVVVGAPMRAMRELKARRER